MFLTLSTTRGGSKVEAVGIRVFILWDISLCTGLDPMVSTGVFLSFDKESKRSMPSRNAFLNRPRLFALRSLLYHLTYDDAEMTSHV